jgi:hypothetical protein
MSPPRITELLVGGLIADEALRDSVLGDLAEEWVERAEASGVVRADWGYRWQAVRALPPLSREWLRRAGWLAAFLLTEKALTVVATFAGGLAIIERRRRSDRALAKAAS